MLLVFHHVRGETVEGKQVGDLALGFANVSHDHVGSGGKVVTNLLLAEVELDNIGAE